jgi:hypothetical protein
VAAMADLACGVVQHNVVSGVVGGYTVVRELVLDGRYNPQLGQEVPVEGTGPADAACIQTAEVSAELEIVLVDLEVVSHRQALQMH